MKSKNNIKKTLILGIWTAYKRDNGHAVQIKKKKRIFADITSSLGKKADERIFFLNKTMNKIDLNILQDDFYLNKLVFLHHFL